ncbi:SPOR domain-containing protein [Thiobaca trueperi]|uniref:Sporulation related protein n=1 Tax=Thiobaca trueperi TaxID=127458 RepID=A0A4R3N4Q7_9GAMM|nr:SPOR domain-containing protein [Thiobaca trueperi]TCT22083.1 sporulation related protein [Thiobaca trueperi]
MAKNYRREALPKTPAQTTPKRKQTSRTCVWWFLLGSLVGVIVGNLYASRRAETPPPEAAAKPASEERPPAVQPSFKFQEILSDTQVDVSDRAPPPPAPRPQPPAVEQPPAGPMPETASPVPEPTAATPGTYVVQAGSFKRAADAERLRAELGLLGIAASVQTATLPNGQTTHRVRTGPYANKQTAEQVRNQLKRNGKDGVTYPVR